jgi:hypothetical protein
MDMLRSRGMIETGESLVRLVHAETLERTSDHPAACAAITAARERLLACAARIADPETRAGFLRISPRTPARSPSLARGLTLEDCRRSGAWSSSPRRSPRSGFAGGRSGRTDRSS